ncbi:MAG: ribonuclease P protein component [Gammaproteobacteria bacterium]|nr:ribonuclease P protein component [Gammaproteobacteria bacterium]
MADQCFPASKRIHNSKEFDAVFKCNQYRTSKPEFLLLARRNKVKQNRLGMVVRKGIIPNAVERNRFKRLIREVFRKTSDASLDFVVLMRPKANEQHNQVLSEILSNSFASIAKQSLQQGSIAS